MAIVVESTASNTAGNGTSLTITKPSGLAVGDAMIAIIYPYDTAGGTTDPNTPSGWELTQTIEQTAGADAQELSVYIKIADSGDVAASDFTFTSTNSFTWEGVILRVSGIRTDDQYDGGKVSTSSSTASTYPPYTTEPDEFGSSFSVTPSQDNVLLVLAHAVAVNETWYDSTLPVINGTNPTWTKQHNGNMDVFTAVMSTAAAITSIDFTIGGSPGGADTVCTLTILLGQNDANTTPTFVTTSNTAFTPSVSAGASVTIGAITETTQETFTATGDSYDPTSWTTVTKS